VDLVGDIGKKGHTGAGGFANLGKSGYSGDC
jgi:hypothetical protein